MIYLVNFEFQNNNNNNNRYLRNVNIINENNQIKIVRKNPNT